MQQELSGYVKGDGNLKLMLIRNAGHSVPVDQPQWMLRIVEAFINGTLWANRAITKTTTSATKTETTTIFTATAIVTDQLQQLEQQQQQQQEQQNV